MSEESLSLRPLRQALDDQELLPMPLAGSRGEAKEKQKTWWDSTAVKLIPLVIFGLFVVAIFAGGPGPKPRHPFHRPPGGPDADEWMGDYHGRPDPEKQKWLDRAEEVKAEFLHAYHAYERSAMPRDELGPLSNRSTNNYNGWGVSVVDAIDTMLLMGCKDEYQRAVKHVANIDLRKATGPIPFFETTIRYLGGFLAAYVASKDPIFLSKADQLGLELLPAFNNTQGMPVFSVDPMTGLIHHRYSKDSVIAEIGTFQLEFQLLAHLTGRREYWDHANSMTKLLERQQSNATGMWGTFFDPISGQQKNDQLTAGGTADSAYEYILKAYLQNAKADKGVREMVIKAINGIIDNLLYLSPKRHLLYVTDIPSAKYGIPSGKQEHLSCFLPGMIALGAKCIDDLDLDTKQVWSWAAEGLATTCWITYADTPSGLGPDEVVFDSWPGNYTDGRWSYQVERWKASGSSGGVPPGVKAPEPIPDPSQHRDYRIRKDAYQLRPETVESLFVLYRTTGDPIWRDRAWGIFEAIRQHCRVPYGGYASVIQVDAAHPPQQDDMPSWFLAETLKYLYLVTSPKHLISLDRWVFNTEAHPLPVIEWRDWERERYGIMA